MATCLRIFGVLVFVAMTIADPGPDAPNGEFLQRSSLWPYNYAMGYPTSVQESLHRIKKDGKKKILPYAYRRKSRIYPRCMDCDNEYLNGGGGVYGNQVRGGYPSGRICNIQSSHMYYTPSNIDMYMNGAEKRYNRPCRIRTQRPPDTKYPEYWEETFRGGPYQKLTATMQSQVPAYGGEMESAGVGGYSEGVDFSTDYGDESEAYYTDSEDFPEYSETYDEDDGSNGAEDSYTSTPQGSSSTESYDGDMAFSGETSGPTSDSNYGMDSESKEDDDENKAYEDSEDSKSYVGKGSGYKGYSMYSHDYGLATKSSSAGDSYDAMSPVYSKYYYDSTADDDSGDSKSSTGDSDGKEGGGKSYQTFSMVYPEKVSKTEYTPEDSYFNLLTKISKIHQDEASKDDESEAYTIYSKGYGTNSFAEDTVSDEKGSEDPLYSHDSEKEDGSKLEGNGYGYDSSNTSTGGGKEVSDKVLDSDGKGEEESKNDQGAENKKEESSSGSKTDGYDLGYSNSIYSKVYEEDNESSAKGPASDEKGSQGGSYYSIYSKEYEEEKETDGNGYSNGYGGKELNQPDYSDNINTEEGYSEGTKDEEGGGGHSYSSYSEDYGEEETNGQDYYDGDEGNNQFQYNKDYEGEKYSEGDHSDDSKKEENVTYDSDSTFSKVDENPEEYSMYDEKGGYDYSNYQDFAEGDGSKGEENGGYSKGYINENGGTGEDYSNGNGGKEFQQSDNSQDTEAEKGDSKDSKIDGSASDDGYSEYSKGDEIEKESPEEYSKPEETEGDESTDSKDTEEKQDSPEGSMAEENDSENSFYEDSKEKSPSEDTPAATSSEDSNGNDSENGSETAENPQSSKDPYSDDDNAKIEAETSTAEEPTPDTKADSTEKADSSKEIASTNEGDEQEKYSKLLKGMDAEDLAKACKYFEKYRESLSRSDVAPDLTPSKDSEKDGKTSIPSTNKDVQDKEVMESPEESIPVEKEGDGSSGAALNSKKKEKGLQQWLTSKARANESPEDDSSEDTKTKNNEKFRSKEPLNLYKMLVSHFSKQKSHPQYSSYLHKGQSAYPSIYGGTSYANHYKPYAQVPLTAVHPPQHNQFLHYYYPKKDSLAYPHYLNTYVPVHYQNHLVYIPHSKTHLTSFDTNDHQHLAGNYAQFYHDYHIPTSNQPSQPPKLPYSSYHTYGSPVTHSKQDQYVGKKNYYSSTPKEPVQSYDQLSKTSPYADGDPYGQSLSANQFDLSNQVGQQKQYSLPIPYDHIEYSVHETHSSQPPQPTPFHDAHFGKYGPDHQEHKLHFGSNSEPNYSNPPSESSHKPMPTTGHFQSNGHDQIDYHPNLDHHSPESYAQLYDYGHPSHFYQQAHYSPSQQAKNYILTASPSPHKPSAKLLQHSYHAESEISSMYTHPSPHSPPIHKFKPSGYVHVKQSEYTVPLNYENSLSKIRYDPKPSSIGSPQHSVYNTGTNYYIPFVAPSPSKYKSTNYMDFSSSAHVDSGPPKTPWTQKAAPAAHPVPEYSPFNRSPFSSQYAGGKPSVGVTKCRDYPFCPPSLSLPNFPVEMEGAF